MTPKMRNWYTEGTRLEYWYKRLKINGVGPEGMWLSPKRWNVSKNRNSRMVDTRVEIKAQDCKGSASNTNHHSEVWNGRLTANLTLPNCRSSTIPTLNKRTSQTKSSLEFEYARSWTNNRQYWRRIGLNFEELFSTKTHLMMTRKMGNQL